MRFACHKNYFLSLCLCFGCCFFFGGPPFVYFLYPIFPFLLAITNRNLLFYTSTAAHTKPEHWLYVFVLINQIAIAWTLEVSIFMSCIKLHTCIYHSDWIFQCQMSCKSSTHNSLHSRCVESFDVKFSTSIGILSIFHANAHLLCICTMLKCMEWAKK